MQKNDNINDKLTVDMQTLKTLPRWQVDGAIVGLGKTIAAKFGLQQLYIRCPWSEIPPSYYKQTNFHFTVTPDRQISDLDCHSNEYKKLMCTYLINCIVNEQTIERAICVYEWGVKGKSHGNLHFHCLIKTTQKDLVEKAFLEIFNKRAQYKTVTLVVKHLKDAAYRNYLYNKYMRKEAQNKVKCLFVKL